MKDFLKVNHRKSPEIFGSTGFLSFIAIVLLAQENSESESTPYIQ